VEDGVAVGRPVLVGETSTQMQEQEEAQEQEARIYRRIYLQKV